MENSRPQNHTLGVHWEYESPMKFEPYPFEKTDYNGWKHYMSANWTLPFWASAAYLVTIYSLQQFMKSRPPFNTRIPLAIWNLCLGIFSIIGFWRMSQELFSVWGLKNGFHKSLCSREGLNEPMAYWSLVFVLSKFVELGDTVWIILRKQELIFLQWYHHTTAMILGWQLFPFAEPITRYLGAINFGIHGIMYPYFTLKSMKIHIPRSVSKCITAIQLLQMFAAISINVYTQAVLSLGQPCARERESFRWIWAIYGSYVFLFGHFFYKTYYSKHKKL